MAANEHSLRMLGITCPLYIHCTDIMYISLMSLLMPDQSSVRKINVGNLFKAYRDNWDTAQEVAEGIVVRKGCGMWH
jgi:hypothetical protein